jgi:hypothetical protein
VDLGNQSGDTLVVVVVYRCRGVNKKGMSFSSRHRASMVSGMSSVLLVGCYEPGIEPTIEF